MAFGNLDKVFAQLQTTATALNKETEDLNEGIREFEERLEQTESGVTVWIKTDITGWTLGYAKVGKLRRVVVKNEISDDIVPLLHATRAVRVAAVNWLPSLADEILRETQAQLTDVAQKNMGLRAINALAGGKS